MATIKTQAPQKGDLVKGHRVAAFFNGLPPIRGEITKTSKSGHSVTMRVDGVLAALGLPRCSEWTWRETVNAYQQKGTRTVAGEGLALIRQPRPKS